MYRFYLRAAAGTIPGFTHVADLYEDGVHLKSEGKYLETVTHYAAVFHDDPHGAIASGLRFWRAPCGVNEKFAAIVWDLVWEVVTSVPDSNAIPSAR